MKLLISFKTEFSFIFFKSTFFPFFFFQTENLESTVTIPDIRLHSNPSAFNVYCNVRHCVLEWQKKEASVSLASKNSVQSGDSDSDEEEESKEPPIKLPKASSSLKCAMCVV